MDAAQNIEIDIKEALKRLKQKSKEISKNSPPPIANDEPLGRLSGGPEHLDLNKDKDDG